MVRGCVDNVGGLALSGGGDDDARLDALEAYDIVLDGRLDVA